jgi:selenocysteine lyase/cysteine desulfurase
MSYRAHFGRFLKADPERIHLAAHSHHLWPDASFDGHVAAWNDAATLADRKWEKIFSEIVPRAQAHVARILGLRGGDSVVFAPSTHEIVVRILSCLPAEGEARTVRVLTTGSEFHSFARQSARLEEDARLEVERVPTEPFATFVERFCAAASRARFDLVYLSHVFFDSGWAVRDLAAIVAAIRDPRTYVVVDGYHAFLARPVDLAQLRDRIFYLAGGYKYAMSGEGCCFAHVPEGYAERPRNTGWFASFGTLEKKQAGVPYAAGGARMFGATFDPTALYRFNAVLDWLRALGVGPDAIHAHATKLQTRFVAELTRSPGLALEESALVVPLHEPSRGNFLTFQTPRAAEIHEKLLAANVVCDVRGDRLRFGFGLYLDEDDVVRGVERIRRALRAG